MRGTSGKCPAAASRTVSAGDSPMMDIHVKARNISKQFRMVYFIVLKETTVGESLRLFWASGQPKEEEEGGVG